MDSGTKEMNNVLIKSGCGKNTKAIFAIQEKGLFSPTAQDILRERIVPMYFSHINVPTYFGGYRIDKQSNLYSCAPWTCTCQKS